MPPMSGTAPMGGMPPMSGMGGMTFNSHNLGTALLFGSWLPETPVEFGLSCMVIALAAALSVALHKLTARQERWMHSDECTWPVYGCNTLRAATAAVNSILHYSLMLLAMTFDIAIFFSVIGGLSLGHLLFGHLASPSFVSALIHRGWSACARRVGGGGSGAKHGDAEGAGVVLAAADAAAKRASSERGAAEEACCGE